MKFWKAVVPNLCISLWLALLTLVILDQFNPLMGFLWGKPFLILVVLCAFASLSSAIVLYRDFRLAARRRRRRKGIAPEKTDNSGYAVGAGALDSPEE